MFLAQPRGHQRDEDVEAPPRHRIGGFGVIGASGIEGPAPLIHLRHRSERVVTDGSGVGLAHDGVEPAERGPLVEGDSLPGQLVGGVEGGTLVTQRDGRLSAHPDLGGLIAGSVGEGGCVSVPGEGLGAVAAGKGLPVQSRELGSDCPETRGTELLLEGYEVPGEAFLDLTGAGGHVVAAVGVDRLIPAIDAGVAAVQRGSEAVLDQVGSDQGRDGRAGQTGEEMTSVHARLLQDFNGTCRTVARWRGHHGPGVRLPVSHRETVSRVTVSWSQLRTAPWLAGTATSPTIPKIPDDSTKHDRVGARPVPVVDGHGRPASPRSANETHARAASSSPSGREPGRRRRVVGAARDR